VAGREKARHLPPSPDFLEKYKEIQKNRSIKKK
jgi:hypothetical protein